MPDVDLERGRIVLAPGPVRHRPQPGQGLNGPQPEAGQRQQSRDDAGLDCLSCLENGAGRIEDSADAI
jgi:hypothetical protein